MRARTRQLKSMWSQARRRWWTWSRWKPRLSSRAPWSSGVGWVNRRTQRAAPSPRRRAVSRDEVLGLRVVADQRGRGLFRLVLERRVLVALDADRRAVEEFVDLDVVLEI